MPSHQMRVALIAGLAAIALIGVIVLVALGIESGTGFGVVTGILGVAVPALLDALAVESRRRNPDVAALADDVREDPEATKPGVT